MVTLGNIDDRLLLYIHLLEPPRVSPPVPLDGVRIFIYDSRSQHLKIIQQVHIDQKMKKEQTHLPKNYLLHKMHLAKCIHMH